MNDVSGQRIEQNIEELALIGKISETGVTRLTWTEDEMKGRDYIVGVMKEVGLSVTIDSVGNIIGKRTEFTEDPDLPSVMIGSHIDTPWQGGKYDGTAGVIAGIEVVRALNDNKIVTRHPIEVVVFAGEELTRFGASFKGSWGMLGLATEEIMKKKWVDKEGVSYWDAMKAVGLEPENYQKAIRYADEIKCYFELHIEQGKVLDEENKSVGIVNGIAGATRGRLTVYGEADHSGATPMSLRKDALTAAAEIVLAAEAAARKEAYKHTVATIGDLTVDPSVMNIIPKKVSMSLEFRGVDLPSKKNAIAEFHRRVSEVQASRNRKVEYFYIEDTDPTPVDEEMYNLLQKCAEEEGIDYMCLPSGAGHDAQFVASITKMGMIFVRSINGISHAPEEFTKIEDIVLGTRVLLKAVKKMAEARD